MTIDFQKYSKYQTAKRKHDTRIKEFESLDLDNVLRGAIMMATGQNTVLGVDYTLQKEQCLKEAQKYSEIASEVAEMIIE